MNKKEFNWAILGTGVVANILGDLVFVGIFNMAAAGAALATVLAQAISVILSLIIIAKRGLPFEFSLKSIKFQQRSYFTNNKIWSSNSSTRTACSNIILSNRNDW